jgi:hypothetical protein
MKDHLSDEKEKEEVNETVKNYLYVFLYLHDPLPHLCVLTSIS